MHPIRSALLAVVFGAVVLAGALGSPPEASANGGAMGRTVVRIDTAVLYEYDGITGDLLGSRTFFVTLDQTGTMVLDWGGIDYAQSLVESRGNTWYRAPSVFWRWGYQ